MGVYSIDRHSMSGLNYAEDIAANESYTHECGIERLLFESELNDMAIFEAIIKNDMQTVVGLNEGTILESELDSLNEAAGGSFFKRIIEFFRKLIEKVKGIIKSFIAKITILCTRDNKKLVEKYKKDVAKKNFAKFKYKYRMPKSNDIDASAVFDTSLVQTFKSINDAKSENYKETIDGITDANTEDDSLLIKLLKETGPDISEVSEYEKEAMDYLFDDEDEYENFGTYQNEVMQVLLNADKNLKALKKDEANLVKRMNDLVNYFNKISNKKDTAGGNSVTFKNAENKAKAEDDTTKSSYNTTNARRNGGKFVSAEENNTAMVYRANACYSMALIAQKAMTTALAAKMNAAKFEIKEARAVWSKAVTFNPKAVKESAELENMVYECCMEEAI